MAGRGVDQQVGTRTGRRVRVLRLVPAPRSASLGLLRRWACGRGWPRCPCASGACGRACSWVTPLLVASARAGAAIAGHSRTRGCEVLIDGLSSRFGQESPMVREKGEVAGIMGRAEVPHPRRCRRCPACRRAVVSPQDVKGDPRHEGSHRHRPHHRCWSAYLDRLGLGRLSPINRVCPRLPSRLMP